MRRIVVPWRIRLSRLHEVLQAAMGWTNTHLYEFQIRDVGFGLPDKEWGDGPIDARKVSLLSAIQDTGAKSFKYHYDFGDGWTHSIKIERTFPIVALGDPMLIEATGRCPPEDVGGPWGYQEFREALADPAHERHDVIGLLVYDVFLPLGVVERGVHERADLGQAAGIALLVV